MKLRVYYDAGEDVYRCQQKWDWFWGWSNMVEYKPNWDWPVDVTFKNKEYAIKFIDNYKERFDRAKSRELEKKKRAKHSKVVYEI